jgi:hypothetical protein
LLMPERLVREMFEQCYGRRSLLRYNGPSRYGIEAFGVYRDYNISSYTDYCRSLGSHLTFFFADVSKQSMAYRIHCLNLFRNFTSEGFNDDPRSVGYILNRMFQPGRLC